MRSSGPGARHRPGRLTGVALASAVVGLAASMATGAEARAAEAPAPGLPLGEADLPETRTAEAVADGVTLMRIVRGDQPATTAGIPTTKIGRASRRQRGW